jgi:hypothetical protein
VQDNPLAAGALAVAVGAAIGLACPATDYEDRAMGETRDQALAKARTVAQQPQAERRRLRSPRMPRTWWREPEDCGLRAAAGAGVMAPHVIFSMHGRRKLRRLLRLLLNPVPGPNNFQPA